MKTVVTCQPARGHFHPLLPLLRALDQAGHEVTIATSASFAPVVRRAGLAAVGVGLDWMESELEVSFPDLVADASRLSRMRSAWGEVFGRAAREFVPQLAEYVLDCRPDLVISEGFELGGGLVAEAAAVPWAQVGIGAMQPAAILAQVVGHSWAFGRSALGLPPDPQFRSLLPDLYLSAYPPSFQPFPLAAMSPVAVSIRPGVSDVDGESITANSRNPLVYVTMGTVFNRISGILETIVAGLANEPVEVIAAIGENRDPRTFGRLPGNVRAVPFVRQREVLEQADVVVFNGGAATTVGALALGKPSLAIPLVADQDYNSFRIRSAGAGLTLDIAELSADRVRASVRKLLIDGTFRANAERLQLEISELPPPRDAVPLLVRTVAIGARRHRFPKVEPLTSSRELG